MGMFPCGPQLALPCAEPDLGFPTDGLERCGELFQAQLPVSTALGWIPIGPGPFAQGTTGMGMARRGHAALLPPPPTGIC
jgi:hypothetical protein